MVSRAVPARGASSPLFGASRARTVLDSWPLVLERKITPAISGSRGCLLARISRVENEERKPWDQRLVEWMSRGSSSAPWDGGSGRKMTPKQRAVYAVVSMAWLVFLVSTNGRHARWWLYTVVVVVAGGTQLAAHFWERRKDRG